MGRRGREGRGEEGIRGDVWRVGGVSLEIIDASLL